MKFKSDIEVQSGLKDSSGANGTSGQVLSSNGTTVSWINAGSSVASDVQNRVKAGVAINKGQAVYVTGADGTNVIVGLASNTSEATSSKTLGLLNATVAINDFADVVQIGKLAGLNTIGATVGDPVWLGTNGNLIYGLINKPYAPAHLVYIGVVTRVNANNGEIFVTVQNGFELKEIHDVDIITTTPTNGDVLGYNGTLWVNKTVPGWLGYTPVTDARTLTINGTAYDLTANRSWNVGTVTSVAALTLGTTGTDLSSTIATGTTTPVITLNVPTASAANRGALSAADWSTFNTKVGDVTASSPLASSGGSTPNITIQQASGSQNGYLSSTDWATFNSKQASGNYITSLTGEATASGPGAASVTLNNASVTAKVLTGINITGGTVQATDTMLTAFGKLQNQINGLIGSSIYQGTWNAATNTPTLASGVGTRGYYYIVNVAGTTNLDGITDWFVGDWVIFDGIAWQQVDNTDAVVSVNGQTGAVSLTTDNIPEGATNQYYLNSRARSALSFTAGSGAYNSTTGVITIPTNTSQLTNGSNFITLASLSGTAPIGYNNTTGAISITQSGTASNGYLSSTDWNTFNNKQNALTNPITGTGTTNYVPKFTGSTALGNSLIYDNGTNVGIGTTSPSYKFNVIGANPTDAGIVSNRLIGLRKEDNTLAGYLALLGGDNGDNAKIIGYNSAGTQTFEINASTSATYFNGGNVGIGTTSPAAKLSVSYSSATADALNIVNTNTNGRSWYVGDGAGLGAGNFGFYDATAGASRLVISSGGNVGIGTTSPGQKLVVSEGGTYGFEVALDTSNIVVLQGYNRSTSSYVQMNYDALLHRFSAGGSERMRITSGGNVGIGTTSPAFKFHTSQGSSNYLCVDNTGDNYRLLLGATGSGTKIYSRVLSTDAAAPIAFVQGGTETVTITSGGNVLIGTTTDSGYKFDVNGTTRLGGTTLVDGSLATIGNDGGAQKKFVTIPLNGVDYQHRYILLAKAPSYGAATVNAGFRGTIVMERVNGIGIDLHDDFDFTVSYNNEIYFRQTSYQPYQTQLVRLSYGGVQYLALYVYSAPGYSVSYIDAIQTNYGGWLDGNTFVAVESSTSLHSAVSYTANTTTFKQSVIVQGSVTANSGFFNSDIRLKELTDYNYNISDIKPISYIWKDLRDNKKHIGYSAQDVQKVMPDAVNEAEDGMLSVNYVEVLVAKIAELENRIKQLEK